jgi:FKBP-type peptidyl-prolyl cis-trans isomerase
MSLFLSLFITLLCVVAALSQVTELQVETTFLPEKCDKKSAKGNKMSMHYTGKIDESSATGEKGKVFDSSVPRKKAFEFTLGVGQVIKGWDEGLLDMCPGEKRVLTIPPAMGYGSAGAGGAIPGGATLHFEVECLDFGADVGGAPEAPMTNIFREIDADGDKKVFYFV